MDHSEILKRFDDERLRLEPSYARREATGPIVRHVNRYRPMSMIAYSRHTAEELPAAVQAEIDYFRGLGHDFEWKTHSHDRPPELWSRLEALGFEIGEEEAVLIADAREVARTAADPGPTVRRLTGPDEVDDYLRVIEQIWPAENSEDAHELKEQLRSAPDAIALYVVVQDGMPVGCSRSSFHPDSLFCGLWGGSVLPWYRGRGVYRSMVARRALDAVERGARYLRVDALPTSRPILERLGFEKLTETRPCVWRHPR